MSFNPRLLKQEFPIFSKYPNLVYLDNAATTQKPQCVVNAISQFYSEFNANIHRGAHRLGDLATQKWEESRSVVKKFLCVRDADDIVFTSGTTESLNKIARILAFNGLIKSGDVVLLTKMEHHSNILPWLIMSRQFGFIVDYINISQNGLDFEDLESKISKYGRRIKAVSVVHISNVLGSVNNIRRVSRVFERFHPIIIVDGAQSLARFQFTQNFWKDIDFYAFSGHKAYGPTGVGGFFISNRMLARLKPVDVGGGIVKSVSLSGFTLIDGVEKFEPGTPNLAGAVGLAEALVWLETIDVTSVIEHEQSLISYTFSKLQEIPNLYIVGFPESHLGVISFTIEGIHAHDIVGFLNENNVATRGGYHCAEPLHNALGTGGQTARLSFGLYNTTEDVDAVVIALHKLVKIFS